MNKEESKVVNDVQQVPTKEITREFVKIPKICIECQISTDFNFACHECRFVKCKRCAMQDIRITRVKLPVYFCKICFNKEKKKT